MRRALAIASLAALAALLGAAPAQGAFGLNDFDVFFAHEEGSSSPATQAGSHPDSMSISFGINFSGEGADAQLDGELKDAVFTFPPGLTINPEATPRKCSSADFLDPTVSGGAAACAAETQVGEVEVELETPGSLDSFPVYNLAPPPGSAARLGFKVVGVPVVVDGRVQPTPPYSQQGVLRNTRQVIKVFGSELTLFGSTEQTALVTLPTSCEGPLASRYEALSWRGETDSGAALTQGLVGCGRVPFKPEISSRATTRRAAGPSGLRFELNVDQEALLDPDAEAASSALKDAVVSLPKGMTANPSLAEGLDACTEGDLDRETLSSGPGEGCPQGSKIGVVEVVTPLLADPLPGDVYIAEPDDPASPGSENPFDSLIAFYIVIKEPSLGVLVKVPAEVSPDSKTGQLVTTVRDAPQVPVSSFRFRFREGARAPLIAPPRCGRHTTEALLTPWARPGEKVEASASFEISQGPGGGACPSGVPPFAPGFEAGSANNAAGAHSPFAMRITRPDGHQDLSKLSAALPPGLTGRLAGLARCPEASIALADAKSARSELAAPSCPPTSRIGSTLAAAGVGEALTWVPGSLYLAGPFNGAPLSVVAITPAKAGPFDAGTVVVRVALRVDPRTALVSVDGAASEEIPHILQGIPLNLRELRVVADRPAFTLNPTSCEPSATFATLWGAGTVLDPLPGFPVGLAARFQAAGCRALDFSPHISLRLRGGTRRGAHPALRAVLRARPGHANIERTVIRLPRSAFVENANFRTICTRVQFAADACPPGAVYGRARAFTPLLDRPLEGPVYLRSSNNTLPDLVFDLKGEVDVEAVARIDSVRGTLRVIAYGIPDAPLSRVVVQMQGGRKGLIVNSRNLCAQRNRAQARFDAHSGARHAIAPVVRPSGCGSGGKGQRSHAKRG